MITKEIIQSIAELKTQMVYIKEKFELLNESISKVLSKIEDHQVRIMSLEREVDQAKKEIKELQEESHKLFKFFGKNWRFLPGFILSILALGSIMFGVAEYFYHLPSPDQKVSSNYSQQQ